MYELKPDHPYTMPMASVFRNPRPWEQGGMRYGKSTALSTTFLTDANGAASLLPSPFRLTEEALVTVSFVQCEDVDWLAGRPYNLVGVEVASIFDGKKDKDVRGGLCVVMWENMTEPIIGGRDHSGVPKVYADITNLLRNKDTCRGDVSHFGHPILELSAQGLQPLSAKDLRDNETALRERNWMNYKYFPSVQNSGADVAYACTYPASGTCTAAWEGQGKLQFFESSFQKNPTQYVLINLLARLPIHEIRQTRLVVWEPFMALDRLPRVLQ